MSNALSLNVVTQVMKDFKIKERSEDGTAAKKTFLERMATYGGTRVRKQLMPKLGKNSAIVLDANGKKRKRSKLAFNPQIHVKQEIDIGDGTQMIQQVVERDETRTQDISSLTLPISETEIENRTKESLRQKFQHIFEDNKNTMTLDEILGVLGEGMVIGDYEDKQNLVHPLMNVQEPLQDMIYEVPPLQMDTSQEHSLLETIVPTPPTRKELKYPYKCQNRQCFFENAMIDSHEHVLDEIFGEGMECVGTECGKTLYECMKRAKNGGAYICKYCKDKECRQMLCYPCYVKSDKGGNKRSVRTRQARTKEMV